MIVYYYRNADQLSPERLTELAACLPQQQQDIIARLKSHRQKCEQVIAYTMLCHALKTQRKAIAYPWCTILIFRDQMLTSRYVKRNAPLWAFGEHGKPFMTNYPGIHFNISHCKEAVAIGINDQEIGIDIEGRRRFSDTLLDRAFNDEEKSIVKNCDDPQKEFACIWTRKEAYFKWTGTGILMDHLKTTEAEARDAGCIISTTPIIVMPTEKSGDVFWLSYAEKKRQPE